MNDPEKLWALSVRQPYVEQILRGSKTIEYRSRATARRGRIYLYASRMPGDRLAWASLHLSPGDLPTGLILGTVEITGCVRGEGTLWHWQLANPVRLPRPLPPRRRPNVTWFQPF